MDQTPPDARMRSGTGRSEKIGVAATSRSSAPRAAASRSTAPSPYASAQGASHSSRRRSRSRGRSIATVDHATIPSSCALSGSGEARPASGHDRGPLVTRVRRMAGTPSRDRPHAGRHPDLDRLDAPVEHRRERGRGAHDAEARVGGIGRDAGERTAQAFVRGLAADALWKRDQRTRLARRSPARPEARDMLGGAADQDDRELGPALDRGTQEVGHEPDPAPLVGPHRGARGDHHAAHVRIECRGDHLQRIVALEAERRRSPAGTGQGGFDLCASSLARGEDDELPRREGARDDPRPVGGGPERLVGRDREVQRIPELGERGGVRRRAGDPELRGQGRVRARDPREQEAGDLIGLDARRERQGAEEPPATGEPGDERDRGRRGPEVDRKEGARARGHHPVMLTTIGQRSSRPLGEPRVAPHHEAARRACAATCRRVDAAADRRD